MRRLLILVLAAAGALFAHYASAGSCGSMGVDIAASQAPADGCVCADGFCSSATVTSCANCLVHAAAAAPAKSRIGTAPQRWLANPTLLEVGVATQPEPPPPEAG